MSALPKDGLYALCLVNKYEDCLQWALVVTLSNFDFSSVREQLLSTIAGKEGGRAPFYQGMGEKVDGIPGSYCWYQVTGRFTG